jgi:tetratricopeptide (TPR) repeat protein
VYALYRNRVTEFVGEKKNFAEMRADILSVLTKLYYFGQTEKIAWASISNFNNTLRIRSSLEKWCVILSTYGVTLVSGGFTSLGLSHFARANTVAMQSHSRTATSIFKARYAYYFLFYNQPKKSIELLEDATNHFRSIGEMWELMTALGALGQNYFLISDFEKSEKTYQETERIARKLNSSMHIGWAYNKLAFIRYLKGTIQGREAVAMLHEGISMSESVHDHMTLCIHYGHLACIAEMENDVDSAILYAKKIIQENRLYMVNIPHVKISWVNAVEALVFALESGRTDINRGQLLALAEMALKKALKQGEKFELVSGPAFRAGARLSLYKKDTGRACELCNEALKKLKNSDYEWEYAHTLQTASRCFPFESVSYLAQSNTVLRKKGILREGFSKVSDF